VNGGKKFQAKQNGEGGSENKLSASERAEQSRAEGKRILKRTGMNDLEAAITSKVSKQAFFTPSLCSRGCPRPAIILLYQKQS